MLFIGDVCCLLFVVCCVWGVRCVLIVVCCFLVGVCCLRAGCWLLFVSVISQVFVGCYAFVGVRSLFVDVCFVFYVG